MRQAKRTIAKPEDEVHLIEFVRQTMRQVEKDPASRSQSYSWDDAIGIPAQFTPLPYVTQPVGKFIGQRGEYAQLAMLEDWLTSSKSMPLHIDAAINTVFVNRVQTVRQVVTTQRILFLLLGLLIGVLVGIVIGFALSHMTVG